MPEDPRCSKYADYLVENYVTDNSKFPPEMWAEVPSNNKRTNNSAESFHAHFNAVLLSPSNDIHIHGSTSTAAGHDLRENQRN